LDNNEITKEEYHSLIGNKAGNPTPNIKMVFMDRMHDWYMIPMNQNPDVNRAMKALNKVEFVVSVTEHTMRPGGKAADIILQ